MWKLVEMRLAGQRYWCLLLALTVPWRRAAQISGSSLISRAGVRLKEHSQSSGLNQLKQPHTPPFAQTIILTIKPDEVSRLQQELMKSGLTSEIATGFNASSANEMSTASALLKKLGYTDSVHWTFSVPFACIHMSPNHYPDFATAASELWSHFGSMRQNFSDMIATDHHRCVAKVAAIAASHVRIWRGLAEGLLPKGGVGVQDDNAWFLILEDDVQFCPGWMQRLEEEIKYAPADAEMLKLSYFGHWREDDAAEATSASFSSPFLEARNTMDAGGVVSNCVKDLASGRGWASMPCTGFYAGNQAYLLKRRGARKILAGLQGRPFQDIDVTIMDLVKTYVWRRVLAVEGPGKEPVQRLETTSTGSFLQAASQQNLRNHFIPKCNQDPGQADG